MRAIFTKYIPATNTKGPRIKAYDGEGNSVTLPYRQDLDTEDMHMQAMQMLVAKMKWHNDNGSIGSGFIGGGDARKGGGMVWVSTEFGKLCDTLTIKE